MNRVKGIKEKLPFITAGDAVVRQLFKLQYIFIHAATVPSQSSLHPGSKFWEHAC